MIPGEIRKVDPSGLGANMNSKMEIGLVRLRQREARFGKTNTKQYITLISFVKYYFGYHSNGKEKGLKRKGLGGERILNAETLSSQRGRGKTQVQTAKLGHPADHP